MAGTLTPISPASSPVVFPQYQYLGAYAAAPTTRPNGDAVQTGDFYIDTVLSPPIYFWNGAAWVTWLVFGSAAASGANSDITSLSGLTTPLSITQGGTGQVTAQAAIDALSAVSGATNEHVLTKDTATGNAIFKAVPASALSTGYIAGLLFSNNGVDAVNDFDISAGKCRYSNDTADFVLASAITKRMDAAWAVGTGNGGLSSSLTFTAATTYHVFAIKVGATDDIGVDTSVTGANLVTDHSATICRHLFSFLSGATPNIPALKTVEDGKLIRALLDVKSQDYSGTGSATRAPVVLSVPTGVQVRVSLTLFVSRSTASHTLITETAQTDTVPSATAFDVYSDSANVNAVTELLRMTDTSGQIQHRTTSATGSQVILTNYYEFIR